MSRIFGMAYGFIAYLFFLATFLYAICFVGNIIVPKTIDSGQPGPLAEALAADVLLLEIGRAHV